LLPVLPAAAAVAAAVDGAAGWARPPVPAHMCYAPHSRPPSDLAAQPRTAAAPAALAVAAGAA